MFLINDLNLGLSLFQGQTQENEIVVSKLIGKFTVKGCFCRWCELWSELSCSRYFHLFFFVCFILLVNDTNFSFLFFLLHTLIAFRFHTFYAWLYLFQKLPRRTKITSELGDNLWKMPWLTQTKYHNILSKVSQLTIIFFHYIPVQSYSSSV